MLLEPGVNCKTYDQSEDDKVSYNDGKLVTNSSSGATDFGGIIVNDSSNIHIGTSIVYKGNVMITNYNHPTASENKIEVCDENFKVIEGVKQLHASDGIITYKKDKIKLRRRLLSWKVQFATLVCIAVVGAGTTTVLFFTKTKKPLDNPYVPSVYYSDKETDCTNHTTIDGLKIISRSEWSAKPRKFTVDKQKLPLLTVVIGHTVTSLCSTVASCSDIVRGIQKYQTSELGDIGYNFLVGGDGNVYCGLGWDLQGTHTYGFNRRSLGVAFVGSFVDIAPKVSQIKATLLLLELGVTLGYLVQDYKVLAQCQLMSTLSPGKQLYKQMMSWPHFDNSTECIL